MKQPQIRVGRSNAATCSDAVLSAALKYWQQDYSLIPCRVDKRPRIAWQSYTQQRPELSQIQQWFSQENTQGQNTQSIGIILGAVSANRVVIDLDGIAVIKHFYQHFPDLCENTRSVLSGSRRGLHLYLRVNELPPNINLRLDGIGGIEVRGNGQYVIAPPSLHPSGHRYRLYRNRPILERDNLADVVDWLEAQRPAQPELPTDLPQSDIPIDASEHKRAYLAKAVQGELARVQVASVGNRNNALFYAALRLANLAAGGEVDWGEMQTHLLDAARRVGTPASEAERTIASAWRIGSQHPRHIR